MSRHHLETSSGKPPILAFIDMIVLKVSSLVYSGACSRNRCQPTPLKKAGIDGTSRSQKPEPKPDLELSQFLNARKSLIHCNHPVKTVGREL